MKFQILKRLKKKEKFTTVIIKLLAIATSPSFQNVELHRSTPKTKSSNPFTTFTLTPKTFSPSFQHLHQ